MIDFKTEELLTLKDACMILPRRRRGRKPHFATLWRWAKRGLSGVKLETLKVGGTLCTSREALQRFFDRLTEADQNPVPGRQFKMRTPAQRQRAIARAEKVLREAGI